VHDKEAHTYEFERKKEIIEKTDSIQGAQMKER
jgi:2,3-bisphosphoglycerate-independent phosphoglycerate mutase